MRGVTCKLSKLTCPIFSFIFDHGATPVLPVLFLPLTCMWVEKIKIENKNIVKDFMVKIIHYRTYQTERNLNLSKNPHVLFYKTPFERRKKNVLFYYVILWVFWFLVPPINKGSWLWRMKIEDINPFFFFFFFILYVSMP